VKAIEVTSTAKGITSKQLLIGTIGDQVGIIMTVFPHENLRSKATLLFSRLIGFFNLLTFLLFFFLFAAGFGT